MSRRVRRQRAACESAAAPDERGAVMILALVMLVMTTIIIAALLNYSTTVVKAAPSGSAQAMRTSRVEAGIRLAVSLQRAAGPSTCFAATQTFTVDDAAIDVTCTVESQVFTGVGRYGAITTANSADAIALDGGAAGPIKPIDGPVMVNAGRLGGAGATVGLKTKLDLSFHTSPSTPTERYDVRCGTPGCVEPPATVSDADADGISACSDPRLATSDAMPRIAPAPRELNCGAEPWWSYAGDRLGAQRVYPALPPVPTYARPGGQVTIGGCRIYFPGRYAGATPLELNGGAHYFASGVYYFERPIVVTNGATVVAGEGMAEGCSFDAEAAFASLAPRAHEITGKGATFLLGGPATLTIDGQSSLVLNRRFATSANRASEDMALRTISFGVATPEVEIPGDVVLLADGATVPADTHTIVATANAAPIAYSPSTLTPADRVINADITQGRLELAGYVFVPHATIAVTDSGAAPRLHLNRGVVASSLSIDVTRTDADLADYSVGLRSQVAIGDFVFTSHVTINGAATTSTARVQIDASGRYAINSWTLDI